MLRRKDVLNGKMAIKVKKMDVPQWGEMHVRALKPSDNTILQKLDAEGNEAVGLVRFVIMTCCNADGTPFFEKEDEAQLLDGPLAPVKFLCENAMAFNGIGANEDLVKN